MSEAVRGVVVEVPLRTRFRGVESRQAMLLHGSAGWAEWSPFTEYDDAEAATWLRAAVEAATLGFPAPVRERVPVNAIVPAVGPQAAAARVREAGCRTAKVKVADPGQSLDDDLARVAAVRDALAPEGRVRVDANGAWSVAEARQAISELAPFGLDYVEQPCASVEELAALRRDLDGLVPIAADESIRRADDPLRVRDAGAADVAVLKVQPLGGVRRCLALADELGLPVVVSSAVETSVGLRMGLALAASLPELPFDCGLETGSLLTDDVVASPVRAVVGEIEVTDADVDLAAVDRLRADDEVTAWWWRRLERVAPLAGAPEVDRL